MTMNLEDTKKLVINVIENELHHIQEEQEGQELLSNTEIKQMSNNINAIISKLLEVAPEEKALINDLESVFCSYWTSVCRYYFKKGVVAGATNLNFLKDTNIVEYI